MNPAVRSITANGWTLLFHPLILEQIDTLARETARARERDPDGYRAKGSTKRLAAIIRLAFHDIPADPTSATFRQGNTLGHANRHWMRAKFFQQYRLFFRYDTASRIIIYAWVNDEGTKRAYGSMDDAYRVFGLMLRQGNPPGDWALLKSACEQADPASAASLAAERGRVG